MSLLRSWFVVYSYSLFVFVASIVPTPRVSLGYLPWDKIIHFLIHLLLVVIVIKTSSLNKKPHPYLFALVYGFSLGLVVEIIQYFLPYRDFETLDILFNASGSIVGLLIYKVFRFSMGKFLE